MAVVDYFLKLDGIEGESMDPKHKGEIEIDSFSFGAHQTGAQGAGGGGGAGKVQFQDLHFSGNSTKASPHLFLKCATGEHIKTGVLTCRKAGGDQGFEFLKIELTGILVSSYQTGGSGGSVPTEQISLNFGTVKMVFTPQTPQGTAGTPVLAGWDVRSNRAI